MRAPRHIALYSPRNFLLGCRISLRARLSLSHAEAAAELRTSPGAAPEGPWRVLLALVAGVALILALSRFVGFVAPAAVHQVAPVLSPGALARAMGLLAAALLAWMAWRLTRAGARFYARMCRLGYAARLAQAA